MITSLAPSDRDVPRSRPLKMQTRYSYNDGPLIFCAQHVVSFMQQAGQDAHVRLETATLERVEISHRTLYRGAGPRFYRDLNACVAVTAEAFQVNLTHDLAQDESSKGFISLRFHRHDLFKLMLPSAWSQHVRSKSFSSDKGR